MIRDSLNPSTDYTDCFLCNLWMAFLLAFVFVIATPIHARADLSKNQARKLIQTMAGWALPGSAVRVASVNSSSSESAEVSAEIQTIFRLALNDGRWELSEIRTGPDRCRPGTSVPSRSRSPPRQSAVPFRSTGRLSHHQRNSNAGGAPVSVRS